MKFLELQHELWKDFNPRSRTGSDDPILGRDACTRDFNPRSRTGSDEIIWCAFGNPTRFQSTLPHGERRREWNDSGTRHGISIHAPARGATKGPGWFAEGDANFNPRSRTGSDCTMKTFRLYRIQTEMFREPVFTGLYSPVISLNFSMGAYGSPLPYHCIIRVISFF